MRQTALGYRRHCAGTKSVAARPADRRQAVLASRLVGLAAEVCHTRRAMTAVLTDRRDHAMWFVDHGQVDLLELKRWMGDVKETIVAKHAARMGLVSTVTSDVHAGADGDPQPFSTSRIVNLEVTLGPSLPDVEVKGPKGTYCFTDGCGVAGDEVMKEAARALGIKKGIDLFPSAIQFRLGSVNGVAQAGIY